MKEDNCIYFDNQHYTRIKLEEVIFQAYLQGFYRHIGYIANLQASGKISIIIANEKINTAWQELQIRQAKLGILDNSKEHNI